MIRAWRRRQRIMFLVAALQSPQGTFAPWKDVKAELQGLITEEFGSRRRFRRCRSGLLEVV